LLIAAYFANLPLQDHDEKLYAIKSLLEQLPPGNYATIRFLSRFLAGVCEHYEVCR